MEKVINKLRYPMTITSILSAIFLILKSLEIIDIEDETINVIINSIVSLLMTVGIVMAPTSNNKIKVLDNTTVIDSKNEIIITEEVISKLEEKILESDILNKEEVKEKNIEEKILKK